MMFVVLSPIQESEMSRVSDAPYHKLMAAPIASLNSLMIQTCSPAIPSTAATNHIPVTDLTSTLACSLLSCSIPTATVITPPPPYHSINHHHNMRPLFDMHNTATITETDVDVVGLSQSTKEVSIQDSDSDQSDKPLDLSLKSSNSLYSPTTSRPSVIIESPSIRNPPVRRSASSVSATREQPDVHEHFRRSLSGKWPRRSKIDDEKVSIFRIPPGPTHFLTRQCFQMRASPITRRTSLNSHGSTCTTQPHVIVSNSGVDSEYSKPVQYTVSTGISYVVDHFRRALSEKDFENWQRKRNAKSQSSK
ncbi:hypothetical protein NECAME_15381 [Necator americanus]|uniref:Uncharacterized protein n=1 Tax=Necator americanus TaxID=51031 RepID=W2SKH2_NECAM|nr:hypothetical protein NECAME_15381 [Necator americanus]ETN69336.1 hypothetical protein NECAME_15381 [Necator americanus]